MHFYIILAVFFSYFGLSTTSSCSFDVGIEQKVNIPKMYVNYRSRRPKRDTRHYLPMRFGITMSSFPNKHTARLRQIVYEATLRISELLYVIPVHGPLHLERTSCYSTWAFGPNRGRCSGLRPNYKEEICGNKLRAFEVPTDHLEQLDIYNFSGDIPITSLRAGHGISGADFALYVDSSHNPWCLKKDVTAFSAYCRLDQFGRPVAGYIHICPHVLNDDSFSNKDLISIALHEILHTVGFSKNLFSGYSGCPFDEVHCELPKHLVVNQSDHWRLMLPTVIQKMNKHFNCSDADFGGPLEMEDDSYSSHWDALLMYGSIMTPTFQNSDLSAIDPITLSVLADSGWYYVNFSNADHYTWGIGGGCEFGMKNECDNKDGFCHPLIDDIGCDFLHHTHGKCKYIEPKHFCGVFEPDSDNDCRNLKFEVLGKPLQSDSYCFNTEMNHKISTQCMATNCEEMDLAIAVNHEWIVCPYDTEVKVGNLTVFCPKAETLCFPKLKDSSLETSSSGQLSPAIVTIIVLITLGFNGHVISR